MAGKAKRKRVSWLDAKGDVAIDDYARRLKTFVKAVEDGVVTAGEVREQEQRVIALMKEVEPLLDTDLHGKVTDLLCELTAFDIMQTLHSLSQARSRMVFRG